MQVKWKYKYIKQADLLLEFDDRAQQITVKQIFQLYSLRLSKQCYHNPSICAEVSVLHRYLQYRASLLTLLWTVNGWAKSFCLWVKSTFIIYEIIYCGMKILHDKFILREKKQIHFKAKICATFAQYMDTSQCFISIKTLKVPVNVS